MNSRAGDRSGTSIVVSPIYCSPVPLLHFELTLSQFKIAPRGFEPLNENPQLTNNTRLTENKVSVLSTSLDKSAQKHPELEQIIKVWPELPEHTKKAIKALIQKHKTEKK